MSKLPFVDFSVLSLLKIFLEQMEESRESKNSSFKYKKLGEGGEYTGEAIYNKENKEWEPHGFGKVLIKKGSMHHIEGNFMNGQLEGEHKNLYETGVIGYEGQVKDGKKQGWCKHFHRNGVPNYKHFYNDGIVMKLVYCYKHINGKCRFRGNVDSEGDNRGFGVMYHTNGQIAFIGKIFTRDLIIWSGTHFLRNGKVKIMNRVVR